MTPWPETNLMLAGAARFNAKFPLGMPASACAEGKLLDQGVYSYSFAGAGTVTNLLDPDSVLKITSAC